MAPIWKWLFRLSVFLLFHLHHATSQTTTLPTTTDQITNTPEVTTPTTTFVPTLTPLITTEGTTFASADLGLTTTTFPSEEVTVEVTTEGQASNEALRTSGLRRGYRFESQRNRQSANQEAAPVQETQTEKPEEKKIAWKFGRGGNNQDSWSARPSPNSGYPVWKKETPTSSGDASQTNNNNKQTVQPYLVWSVGQGNQPSGWTLSANPNGWTTTGTIPTNGGWASSDGSAGNSPGSGSWDTSGWTEDQASDSGDSQDGWTADNATPDDGTSGSWDNNAQGVWNSQADNSADWANAPSQGPSANGQGQTVWASQGNVQGGGAWNGNLPQQGGNGGGWSAPQQGTGWVQPQAGGTTQGGANGVWNGNSGSWTAPPASTTANSWNNGAPAVASNVGWNNGQQNSPGWRGGNAGSAGWQDGGLSWKVYNEDTKTMENLDDTSGWKVVGDGGPDGWKLVDENGNVEWKIENINGEWKVTSADEFSQTNGTSVSLPTDSVNATSGTTNTTSTEAATTTPAPGGGWDDEKQGRYIIWKFSDDGKGEARVYGGGGTEPEVWTVGDNNQWWKETMGVKEADTVVQGGWNSGGNSWQGNGGWPNTAPQTDNSWQSNGNRAGSQNGGGQSANGSPSTGGDWQQTPATQNGGTKWQNNRPVPQNGGNAWQTGGTNAQRGGNRWQQQGGTTTQKKWKNGVSSGQSANGWQNQAPANWNAGNTAPATNSWKNAGPNSQPNGGPWQSRKVPQNTAWQNGPPPASAGWSNNGQSGGTRKGRGRNNGNRPAGRWASNNVNAPRKNKAASGRVWNSGSGWRTAPGAQGQGNGGWANNAAPPPPSPPPDNSAPPVSGGQVTYANSANDGGWARNSGGGQTVPYIIIIKAPDSSGSGGSPNSWTNSPNGGATTKKPNNNNGGAIKPQNNRRNNGWKMNRAGSSGWQWNPQGGSEGWQWRDGWMGSGGGFGGWMSDKRTMYSNWRPTKTNGAQSGKFATQRIDGAKGNKKSASKMVFVFGTKKNSGNLLQQPSNKVSKKGKQVIIIDYTTGPKKVPNGEEGMKKDIESVIQALKTAKPTGVRGSTTWKQTGQKKVQPQQWSR